MLHCKDDAISKCLRSISIAFDETGVVVSLPIAQED